MTNTSGIRYVSCEQVSSGHYVHVMQINGETYRVHSSKNEEEYRENVGIPATEAEEVQIKETNASAS